MIIPRREWLSKGFDDGVKVGDVLVNGCYCWPFEWLEWFPGLLDRPMFLNDRTNGDGIVWRDKEGVR